MRYENLTCRGLFFISLELYRQVPLNDYDFLFPKVLSNDKTKQPLAQVQIFGLAHTHCMGLQHFYGKRPHLLLWAGLWSGRGKITVSGILHYCQNCVIFIVYAQFMTSVTTQNVAFLSYWYRKKHLHMHF